MKETGRNDPCPCGSGKKYKQCCQQRGAAAPDSSDAAATLGAALEHHRAGRLPQAEALYRQILEASPSHPDALHYLGAIASAQGRHRDAAELIAKAIRIKPSRSMHYNLGNALKALGRLEEAADSYRRALALKPNYAEAHVNLGNVLQAQGHLEDAALCYRSAIQANPNLADAHFNLGHALRGLNVLETAEKSYRKALALRPESAEAQHGLGLTLRMQGEPGLAAECYRRALAFKPDWAEAHNDLGGALKNLGQLDEALRHYRMATALRPDYADAHNNLGGVLRAQGNLDGAIASYRHALVLKPDSAITYSNLLFLYAYHALLAPHEYLAQARCWEKACVPEQDRQMAHNRTFQRPPLAGRRLKVGYVSGDFRQHAVSFFVEQLFIHHDRARVELFAYSNHGQRDAVTGRLQALVDHWIPVSGIPDAVVRDLIEADGIDVLIDLSGHTAFNRLGVFALRAAPVQAYYLGYFASTGLTEMDYWIGDEILTPPETDSHFTERVWRLPRISMSYTGKAEAPLPDWQPDPKGVVRVGSFNNLGKLTPATLALWAKVLHALPEAKLLLKTKELADTGNCQRILNVMTAHGIAPDRVELKDGSITPDWPSHMAYYDRMDIALDPVGGHGGVTTTCDALWMAAPVVTLKGDRVTSRMTASMLDAIGHPEWTARSEVEYVGKVVALAQDVERRKALRSTQRERMAHCPLCDANGLATSLESAYFEMFQRWMERL